MSKVTIDNRYKVINKIGAGATGTVYKVKDLKNNSILALKILSKQKTSSEAVQRFKREFRLLAGLNHPNLCSVYDFGTLKDGRTYFTMEYIDGQNIFKAAKGLSYKKVYPWIVQLCRALEYIHSKGLIHYDIKPGNILIARSIEQRVPSRRDGNPSGTEGNKKLYAQDPMSHAKLMDFGLADEQRIKGGALIRGTFPYIAPEVIKGLAIDHRADLYSLGVLLYEIFTRKSFQEGKESFVTLLQQRIQRGSELPSKIIADIPVRLERLIVKLLRFEPAARFNHANEVITEINKLSRCKYAIETEKTIEGYLLSSRFVGRDKEMEQLQSLYKHTRQGEGKVVLIIGDAGIGKSRLLKEFKIFTQLQRSHSFTGYAHRDKISPLEPFYDIFSGLINYVTDGSALKTSLAVLFKIFPDLTDGYLRKNLPRLVPLGPKEEKLRNFEALSELIKLCAKNLGKLVILLEDLHWADDLTIQFLEYLCRNVSDKNIFICATSREEELEEHAALKKMIQHLKNEDRLHQIELRPLRFKNLYSFLDSTITPSSNSSELVRYLMEKTGGNPFFVEEIMRTLLRKGKVSIGEKIETDHFQKVSIPETIEDVVLKRLKDLNRVSQKVVKFATVLLKDFNYDVMKQLTNLDDTELSRSLWELRRKQVLVEEGTSYHFYHATLRETLHKRLSSQEKRKLNYQVGKILENIYKKNKQRIVEDLAYYFINAKDRERGVKYGLQASKKSRERYAYNRAIQFYKGVLGLLGDAESRLRFDILYELSRTEKFVDFYDDAIKHYYKALNLKAGTIEQKMWVYAGIAGTHERRREFDKALHIYQRAIRFLKKMKGNKLKVLFEANINVGICRSYVVLGHHKKANKFNIDAMRFLGKSLKDKKAMQLKRNIYSGIANIELFKAEYGKGDYDKALLYYKEVYRNLKKTKDEFRIALTLNNLSAIYFRKFDFQKAIEFYQKAIQISKKIGDQYGVSMRLGNLGSILKEKGNYSKALDCFHKTLSISKKIGNPSITGLSLLALGDCSFLLCNYKEAIKYSEESLKIFDSLGWQDKKSNAIKGLGNTYQTLGDYTSALRFYRKALKISKDIEHQGNIASLFTDIGSLSIKIGKFFKAKRYIDDALKIAIAIGEKNIEIDCYIHLCRICIMIKDYITAIDHYRKAIKITKKIGMTRKLLRLFLLASGIYHNEKKYLEGTKFASMAIKLARDMGTKDLYVEALLMKVKNETGRNVASKRELTKIIDEAIDIAQEIGKPEILWKIYFEYGKILQNNKDYLRALDYFQKCIEIFMDVRARIKNKSYKKSYLNRSDRQAVFTAIDTVERLL